MWVYREGVQISNDSEIDGYGYHTDTNDFRTTRVVIQCKRYDVVPVKEPEINQFLGAMNKCRLIMACSLLTADLQIQPFFSHYYEILFIGHSLHEHLIYLGISFLWSQ